MRKMKKILMTMMLLSVTVSLVAACGNKQKAADVTATADGQVTEEVSEAAADLAPDFELPALQGNTLKLSSLRGKYVVLDFWGSWCVWCIRGIPAMKEAYAKYKDKMEILGMDCNDTKVKWKRAVEEHMLPWKHVYVPKGSDIYDDYRISGFPTKVIISPEGKVVNTVIGEDPMFYDMLDKLFK
jgi:thiol-disulfide isomerase/thioredoxin